MKTFAVGGLATQQRVKHGVLVLLYAAMLLQVTHALAEPRSELPPWPEQTLGIWGFNETLSPYAPTRVAVGAESAQMVESWSGYALTRNWQAITPVAIPVSDPYSGKPSFTTAQGTVRVWFCADWSSASLEGKGPGGYARLIELVGLSGKEPETFYSLYLNPEGTAIYLSGQGVGGPTDFLKADVNWTAGQWHLLALNYDGKQTSLSIDARTVATGTAMPDVAAWKKDSLALLLGSDIVAGNTAQGRFDELCTFDEPQSADDLRFYWRGMYRTVAMGPLGTPEEEQLKMKAWNEQLAMTTMESGYELPPFPEEGDTNSSGGGTYEWTPTVYPSNALWLEITSVTNDVAYVTIHGTIPDVWYELLSKEDLTNDTWQSESPLWLGTEDQDWTAATVQVGTRTNHLFIWARSYADNDGSGLPEWWQMEYFGQTGVDSYADADGDGWVNIQEFQNGTAPTVFNTPPAPQGVRVSYNASNSAVTVKWSASLGTVTGYVIERIIPETGQDDFFTNGPSATTYSETFPIAEPDVQYFSPSYSVTALYVSGNSYPSTPQSLYDPSLNIEARLLRDENNNLTLLATSVATEADSLLLTRVDYDVPSGNPPARTHFNIAVSNLQSGIYTLPTAWTTNGEYTSWNQFWYVQGTADPGRQGEPEYAGNGRTEPFKDGREHLRQNLIFLLRAANTQNPFAYWVDDGFWQYQPASISAEYVYADYYSETRDEWSGPPYLYTHRPFYDNYDYRNFVFSTTNLYSDGFLNTGVDAGYNGLTLYLPGTFGYSPVFGDTNVATILEPATSRSLLQSIASSPGSRPEIGITQNGSTLTLEPDTRNVYGLPYLSVTLAYPTNSTVQFSTVTPGGSIAAETGYLYPETADPVLQNTGYYFCNPQVDPYPGYANFSTTNQTPAIFASVGDAFFSVAGYAKYSISNGYAGKYAYLGQYFDKAYSANPNGTRSTNETGTLSPYGVFFATEPGKTFLTTKTDAVSTNIGECEVNVIKLQLDVNHDGIMDTSWNGPDNTAYDKPFVFWVNNDRDDPGSGGNLDRDIWRIATNYVAPDSSFEQLRSARNLEDFARLWICGVPDLISSQEYSATLTLNAYSGDPAINVYLAHETNGGILYLTDTNVAYVSITNPVTGTAFLAMASGPTYVLPSSFFDGTTKHLLFEGAGTGRGELVLGIYRGSNLVCQTSAWLDLRDVNDLYEEVGVTNVIQTWPEMVQTNLYSGFVVASQAKANTGDEKQLAVFVHGWRMPYADYKIFSQTMFKRLYWQGYQGKFAALRWPTRSSDTDTNGLDLLTYNRSEYISFQSGTGAALYLYDLRQRFPDYTISVCSHSQGGIIMMEALTELANANENPIDHYVMMETAVPAHCYDPAVTNLPALMNMEQNIPTPNTYSNYAAGIRSALRSGNICNLFNPVDFALVSGLNGSGLGSWESNQELMKPVILFGYVYLPTNGVAVVTTNQFTEAFGVTNLQTRIVTDPLELMPFVSRPHSKAVGAQAGVGQVVNGPEYNIQSQLGFTAATYDHSGQFNRSIQTLQVQGFYSRLRSSLFPPAP